MRIKKLMNDSFYVNSEDFTDVNSVDSLSSDLYFHYTKDSGHWKLSGNTAARASGVILEDSDTTAITVTPSSKTGATSETQQLAVVNQDDVNVLSECTFSATTAKATVSSDGLITLVSTGTTSVVVTHPDIPSSPTTVPVYIYWPGSITITAGGGPSGTYTGYTGDTFQSYATMDTGGYDVTTVCTWTSDDETKATVGAHTGLITFVAVGSATITATYPTGVAMGRGITIS
jgi:hypothetical protein